MSSSAANQQQPPYKPPPVRERRRMARRRGYDGDGGSAGEWVDRWRDGVDTDIAQLQRDYVEAGKTMVEVRQWIINHDKQHAADNQSRQRIPDDVRGWIATAISIFALLLTLYLNHH